MSATLEEKVLPEKLTAIVEYSATAAALADLKQRYKDVVFDLSTRGGMQTAIKGRAELRGWRVALEKERVRIKAPSLERVRLIDSEAKRITVELAALENPIDEAIQTEQTRKERERAELEAAEAARVAGIQERLAKLNLMPANYVGKPSAFVATGLEELRAPDEYTWAHEFAGQAQDAKARTIAALEQLHAGALAQEQAAAAEADRIRTERAELARLRAEQDERNRTEQARIAEETRKRAQEAADARAKIAEEERASRERIEAQEREARIAREAEERKAREARAAEDARQQAIADEQRKAREAQEAEAKAVRDAEEARQRVERERLEQEARALAEQQRAAKEREAAVQRELERQRVEFLDGRALLAVFVERYGKRREFAGVVKAINTYLNVSAKEAA